MTQVRICIALVVCLSTLSVGAGLPDRPTHRIKGNFSAFVHCKDLRSPDGLAIHPASGELYVSEETAGRISVIRNRKRVTVVKDQFKVTGDIPRWAISPKKPESAWREQKIHSPEGIAFTAEGHLFVTEDVPNGRLLEFIPDDQGRFLEARVHPIPWLDNEYAWEGITVAKDGRIFIAGSTENSGPGLFFGTVLMRDTNEDWWVVDYGPFNSFSSVALSKDEDILVVGDSVTGSVNWWDALRHNDIGVSTGIVADIEGVCVLPDGAILAAQESTSPLQMNAFHKTAKAGVKGGKLVYMNPLTHESFVAAEGFGSIESVLVDPASGYVYVTEDSSGMILELRPKEAWDTSSYALNRTVKTYENAKGLAPKTWPPFLKEFFFRMGVGTRDETTQDTGKRKTFTPKEFAERVPMIAGRFQAKLVEGVTDPDPVVEVDFVSFFPGKTINAPGMTTPSLSLFVARHQSGKLERSRVIGDMKMFVRQSNGGKWTATAQQAYMLLPLVSCATVNTPRGIDINMAFMEVDSSPDYFLQVPGGQTAKGTFYSDQEEHGKSRYEASFVQKLKDGGEVHNLVVAGFEGGRSDVLNWYEIGRSPVSTLLSIDPNAKWVPRALRISGAPLMALLEERKRQDRILDGDFYDAQQAGKAKAKKGYYVPTVSLEHIKGSLDIGNKETAPPAGGEHAHQGESDGFDSANAQTSDGKESVSVETSDGQDDTAMFKGEAAYWEVALYNRAIEAWGSIE